ncbi:MAG: pyridoxal phosphate-dependent aminotransferase, partial [Polyangiaceae bacterium]|nr:pyridoxal phosphate-dependent aminotransferase [Polyangiaceae bacterium]
IERAILARVLENLAALDRALEAFGKGAAVRRLPVEAGWYAILEVPRTLDEDAWISRLVREEGILVHPGYFFDMEREGFLVVSLLPDPKAFASAASRLIHRLEAG